MDTPWKSLLAAAAFAAVAIALVAIFGIPSNGKAGAGLMLLCLFSLGLVIQAVAQMLGAKHIL